MDAGTFTYRRVEHGIANGEVSSCDMVHVFQQPFVQPTPDVLG